MALHRLSILPPKDALANSSATLISDGLVTAVHDCSDGGAAVAVAEMALAGNIGVDDRLSEIPNPGSALFGEDQGRYVVTTQLTVDAVQRRGESRRSLCGRSDEGQIGVVDRW